MTNIHQPHHSPKGRFFGYLRVSTPKQGEGVSLLTQREEIARFAARKGFLIVGWFEEKETAAKRGRPVFGEVLKRLRKGEADGLIVHKVDRSARNLKDWADLGELIDQGIPVYFAGEGIDMNTRSGRLAADIQAVVAADYIRNLREEAKRGIEKRLEQGFFPSPAPVGYLDRGAGKAKEIDPERGPLVRLAFTWYATGDYTLQKLVALLYGLGLRNRAGAKVTIAGLSVLLRNPFYMGYMHLRKRNKLYPGLHVPIVSKDLFFEVQSRLKSRVWPRPLKHRFKYSRMFACGTCGRSLVGSERKGYVYYRCSTMTCPTVSVREDRVESALSKTSCGFLRR
ncbi:MAG TPA: recombinase family protein [Thermoanaerobaculia bacterium]|jgi:site-specific DNA recombinase|nr:recombinase family protein [Thermoanaerobaculia bacterium]